MGRLAPRPAGAFDVSRRRDVRASAVVRLRSHVVPIMSERDERQ